MRGYCYAFSFIRLQTWRRIWCRTTLERYLVCPCCGCRWTNRWNNTARGNRRGCPKVQPRTFTLTLIEPNPKSFRLGLEIIQKSFPTQHKRQERDILLWTKLHLRTGLCLKPHVLLYFIVRSFHSTVSHAGIFNTACSLINAAKTQLLPCTYNKWNFQWVKMNQKCRLLYCQSTERHFSVQVSNHASSLLPGAVSTLQSTWILTCHMGRSGVSLLSSMVMSKQFGCFVTPSRPIQNKSKPSPRQTPSWKSCSPRLKSFGKF